MPQRSFIGVGLAVGMGLGVALGVATGNLAIGIALGTALGVVFGALLDAADRGKQKSHGGDVGASEASDPRHASGGAGSDDGGD